MARRGYPVAGSHGEAGADDSEGAQVDDHGQARADDTHRSNDQARADDHDRARADDSNRTDDQAQAGDHVQAQADDHVQAQADDRDARTDEPDDRQRSALVKAARDPPASAEALPVALVAEEIPSV
jgi:hypothetical protein